MFQQRKPCLSTAASLSELKLWARGDVEYRRKLLQPIMASLWRLWGVGRAIFVKQKGQFEGLSFDGINFPGSTVNFCLKHVLHFLKAFHVKIHLRYLGLFLVHLWHQNFTGKLHIRGRLSTLRGKGGDPPGLVEPLCAEGLVSHFCCNHCVCHQASQLRSQSFFCL